MPIQIIRADARHLPLRDNSVHCVVTSPPYWGLRKYAGQQELAWGNDEHRTTNNEWRGAFGLEPTIEMYVEHTVEILREIRRVLRPDGVCFWNIGDSYASVGKGGPWDKDRSRNTPKQSAPGYVYAEQANRQSQIGNLKSKDLCLIPARVALAAQTDGWWVRSDIIWAKPNPMPESIRDRPTDAYEHILMLTKSARYFWDAEAVKELATEPAKRCGRNSLANVDRDPQHGTKKQDAIALRCYVGFNDRYDFKHPALGRNLRNVWTFATQPYKGAHFATFPEELVRRCIAAGTSERGCCPQCGAPWVRMVKRESLTAHDGDTASAYGKGSNPNRIALLRQAARERGEEYAAKSETLGWRASCSCPSPELRVPSPAILLDPFAGSGTVGEVAYKMGRSAILIDLAYQELQRERIPPMIFAERTALSGRT